MAEHEPQLSGPTHTVRTRWTWPSLAVLLAGVVVTGVGVIMTHLVISLVGAAVLVVGAVGAWRSGLMWDVDTSSSPGDALDSGRGPVERPGARSQQSDPAALEDAEETAHGVQRRVEDRRGTRLNLMPVGAWLLLLAGAWLALSQWTAYPETPTGREGSWRAMGAAIVLLLVGTGLLLVGRSLLATALAALVGVALVLGALLAAHDTSLTAASELVSGVVVLLGAALSADRRPRR